MDTIASRLLDLRGNLSRRSFAEQIGTTESTLRNYENGTSFPSSDLLEDVCRKMRISAAWLLLGQGLMRPDEEATPGADVASRLAVLEQRVALLEAENNGLKQTLVAKDETLVAKDETLVAKEEALSAYKLTIETLRDHPFQGGTESTGVPAFAPSAPLSARINK